MSDEIISGLRNALERGESLDKAAQSFLNAGYNPNEVKESVNAISQGATNITLQATSHSFPNPISNQVSTQNPPLVPQSSAEPIQVQLDKTQKPKKKHTALIIVLVVILLALAGVLVSLVLLGNQILAAMQGFLK
jgi:hypothetical protein